NDVISLGRNIRSIRRCVWRRRRGVVIGAEQLRARIVYICRRVVRRRLVVLRYRIQPRAAADERKEIREVLGFTVRILRRVVGTGDAQEDEVDPGSSLNGTVGVGNRTEGRRRTMSAKPLAAMEDVDAIRVPGETRVRQRRNAAVGGRSAAASRKRKDRRSK